VTTDRSIVPIDGRRNSSVACWLVIWQCSYVHTER